MATRAEKAVTLAKDVLAQLKSKKLIATRGVYLDDEIWTMMSEREGEQLQPLLEPLEECQVCALGSLFVAKVARYNKFECQGDASSYDLRAALKGYFGEQQLFDIETAFECSATGNCDMRAVTFGRRYDDDEERLAAIMRNIVRNKGAFVIPKSCSTT